MRFHLAQFNVATLRASLDDPLNAPFRDALDRINALAEAHRGFVWRATGEGFDSNEPSPSQDPFYLKNLSVWESAEALAAFAYRSDHRDYVRRAKDWFLPPEGPSFVLWWIPAGEIPNEAGGAKRLAHLAARGPSPEAFDFRHRSPRPTLAFSSDAD